MRFLLVLVGLLAIGCASAPTTQIEIGCKSGTSDLLHDIPILEERFKAKGFLIEPGLPVGGRVPFAVTGGQADWGLLLKRGEFSIRRVWEDTEVVPQTVVARTFKDCRSNGQDCVNLFVDDQVLLGNSHIEFVQPQKDQNGQTEFLMSFTEEGSRIFGEVTTKLVKKKVAMVLDGEVLMAPVIQEPILGGKAHIMLGAMKMDDAHQLGVALEHKVLQCEYEVLAIAAILK